MHADRHTLASAVSNLVQNAIKFTPTGGRITISAHAVDEQRGVEANGGKLYVRNRPEKGCVFTAELPRS